jgi:AraC family transcriptional regulator of adaptative response/methylated-DNA-[protein]-cysteine methyltransferase
MMPAAMPAPAPPEPARAWKAVLSRNAASDGLFVFGVSTTGVYCRPSCPARRPRRENVSFFAGPAEAEAAGFRPCLRCRPASAEPAAAVRAVQRALAFLESHAGENVPLPALARAAGLSPFHLQRTFRKLVGVTPKRYADSQRADRLRALLRSGSSVAEASFEAGYGSSSRAYTHASRHLGTTPARYRRGGGGLHVRYTTLETPIGRLLVGATDRGVCSVMLGDGDRALEANLRREYPEALIERAPEALAGWASLIAGSLSGTVDLSGIPLDLRATTFQRRIFEALRAIPRGETRSYAELAASVGRPTAIRAAASACARNPVALVVPCHRIVRSDGGVGGYRWGVDRKREILSAEGAVIPR